MKEGWMDGEADLTDQARTDTVGAYEKFSMPTVPDTAHRAGGLSHDRRAAEDCLQEAPTPGGKPFQNLTPKHILSPVIPGHRAEKVRDSAVWSLGEVGSESMVDEREADLIRRALLGDAGAYDGILTPYLPIA